MKKHYSHGEVNFFEIGKLPTGVTEIEIKDNFYIIGESETHGNDHRVAVLDKEKVKLFEKDGILYLVNNVETKIYCPNETRHDDMEILPSIYEIRKAQEYDYFASELRKVMD